MRGINSKIFPVVILVFVSLCVAELASFLGVMLLKQRKVFYNSPLLSTYDDYVATRHPVLGSPSQKLLEKCDSSGSRPIPAFPEPGNACISLYGDSFTWGDAVDNEHAWSNQLSRLRNCRVANYGVPGYGTDQALLRFESHIRDEAPIVLLNHFTGDIRRNVTQFRNLTSDHDQFLLKPRFLLDGDGLRLIPLPFPTREEAAILAKYPEQYLTHEFFTPGSPAGIQRVSFPFTLSLARVFQNEHLRAKFEGRPVWEGYYRDDHPSQALEITFRIMKRFVDSAKERGKRPIISIIANAHDVNFFRKNGRWSYEPLLTKLRQEGIEVIDTGPGFDSATKGADICSFMEEGICYGHFNEAGYRVLAEVVHHLLSEH